MKEYPKIDNVFKFDEKYREVVGLNDRITPLFHMKWIGTEKIDGTNIRIYWDGHTISFAGRTNKSEIPNDLFTYLTDTFGTKEMEYVFEQMFGDKEVYLFGEGYGPKIQLGGEKYSDTNKFILFDVNINGIDLIRSDVDDIAKRLGIESVPVVFEGSISEAIRYVSSNFPSTLGDHTHEMEGIVIEPEVKLYDRMGKQFKFKIKYRDVKKLYKGEN